MHLKSLWLRMGIIFGACALVLTSISIYFFIYVPSIRLPYDILDLLTWGPSYVIWTLLEAYYLPHSSLFFLDDTLLSTDPMFPTTIGIVLVIATSTLAYALIGAWVGWLIESVQFSKKRARTVRD